MRLAEAPTAGQPSSINDFSTSPLQKFENFCGFRRFEPVNKIGFSDGVRNLATRTRGFFGSLFSLNRKR